MQVQSGSWESQSARKSSILGKRLLAFRAVKFLVQSLVKYRAVKILVWSLVN